MSENMDVIYPDLKNKTILVTGASRGIGKAIALNLAKQKAHIVFNYRGEESKALELKEELLAKGASQVSPLAFDLVDFDSMSKAITEFTKNNEPISGFVSNAGISRDQIILRLKQTETEQTLDTNLLAPMMLCQALGRGFLKASDVSIVTISSVVGLMGNPSQMAYAASKAGLIGMTKSLAKELASRNVRANAICPGFIETDMTKALSEDVASHYKGSIPLGRFGQAQEVASLCTYLLSRASSYITGEVIKVDGGLYI